MRLEHKAKVDDRTTGGGGSALNPGGGKGVGDGISGGETSI